MEHNTTALVGLTGGIAAGKSTVSALLREAGVPIIDADLLAREVVEPGSSALQAIVKQFGPQILKPDGTLNRSGLGQIVFSDCDALGALNAITHPAILERARSRFDDLKGSGHPWCVYEAALIIENNLSLPLDLLIGVLCTPEEQIRRLRARNGLNEEQARARLAAQVDNDARVKVCDVLIRNDSDHEALIRKVSALKADLDQRFTP